MCWPTFIQQRNPPSEIFFVGQHYTKNNQQKAATVNADLLANKFLYGRFAIFDVSFCALAVNVCMTAVF